MAPQLRQIQRPLRRRTSSSSGTDDVQAGRSSCPRGSAPRPAPWPGRRLRGKPSRMKPGRASGRLMRSRSMRMISSSGTSSPRSMYSFACRAQLGVHAQWPRAACRRWRRAASRSVRTRILRLRALARARGAQEDQIQFGFPYRMKPGVVAHHQLRLELLHRVQHHADDDEQSGAADRQRLHVGNDRREVRHDGDHAQEEGAGPGDAHQHSRDVLMRRPSGTDAGDEAALLLQVLRQVLLR